jgi:predicted alpha/beta hydrolase family esterase
MKKILWIHWRSTKLSEKKSAWFERKKDFENRWFQVDLPQFDYSEDPTYESWERTLKTIDIESYDCIVTTSHGWWVIINYLKENNLSISKLILVCPWKGNTPRSNTWKLYNELLSKDINLVKQIKDIYVLHSKDDDCVPFENWKQLAEKIWAKFIECNWFWHKFRWEWIKLVNDLV